MTPNAGIDLLQMAAANDSLAKMMSYYESTPPDDRREHCVHEHSFTCSRTRESRTALNERVIETPEMRAYGLAKVRTKAVVLTSTV